jgi:MtrB/PioB family decaheme-associated outer membrane protein
MITFSKNHAVSALTLAVQGALVAMFALPLAASGAEGDADVVTLTHPTNSIEVGVENVSQSSAKFGEYNGLDKSGAEFIGNFSVRGGDAYGTHDGGSGVTRWEIKGTDLGTTSRELGGTVGSQGNWNFGIIYDELRHHITNTYQTPFQGSMGGNNFALPATFGIIDTNSADTGTQAMTAGQLASFRTVDVYSNRKNMGFNSGYILDRQWSFQFDYNRLDQSGAKLVAAASDSTGGGVGENSVTLMNPTNYQTDSFNLALTWVGDAGHLTASYFASLFKDGYDSLSWSNSFFDGGGSASGTLPVGGVFPVNIFAIAPNNNLHQLNLAGGYDFTSTTKLAGGLSFGRNTQNSSFINDPLLTSPLPQGSLDGLVVTKHADLKLTDQTTKDLLLSAGLKYNERDNRTASNVYASFASIAGDPWGAVVNTPMSNKKYQLELAANFRFDKKQSVRFAYEYENVKRWCNNSLANTPPPLDPATVAAGLTNVATAYPTYYTNSACVQSPESKENKLAANYKFKATSDVGLTAGYSYSSRKAEINSSYYNPMQTSADGVQNFGYVPYFDATRKEQMVKAGVNWRASDNVSVGLNGRYLDDKYDATLGVQKGHAWGVNMDVAYSYSGAGTVSAYWSMQNRQRDLSSSADRQPLAPVAADTLWTNRLTDDNDTLGINVKQKGLMGGKLEVAGDLSYSLGKTRYSTQAQSCTNYTAPDALCGDAATNSGEMPDIKNEMLRLKLTGSYDIDKASKLVLSYMYKKLKSDDYYYSAYQLGSTDYNVLPTNQAAPNYSVNVVGVSYIYSFR